MQGVYNFTIISRTVDQRLSLRMKGLTEKKKKGRDQTQQERHAHRRRSVLGQD